MVAADSRSAGDILASLKAGNFHASTGPDFTNLSLDGTKIHVGTSPVDRIILAGDRHRAEFVAGSGLSEARFDLADFNSAFFRVVAIDAQGHSAWSNPYWMDEIRR